MFVCRFVWLHDFIPKFSQSPPPLARAPDIDRFSLRARATHPSSELSVLQPLSRVSFMRWPCLLPGDQGHPGSHPGCLHTRGKSGHNLSVGTCQTCPENSTSRLTVRMLLRAPHTRGEFKWLHYIHWPVDLALDSSLFSSWAELCFALMGRLSYVRRDYLIRIPPHEPVLIPCSFTHLEVRPLMTWVQTCNWTFCSVKAQARDTDYFRYEYFVVL